MNVFTTNKLWSTMYIYSMKLQIIPNKKVCLMKCIRKSTLYLPSRNKNHSNVKSIELDTQTFNRITL